MAINLLSNASFSTPKKSNSVRNGNLKGKLSGGTVSFYNGYEYHTFTSSGILTVTDGFVPAEVLLIGGGGGAGRDRSGGGGAGGHSMFSTAISPGAVTIVVGAGGSGGNNSGTNSTNGSTTYINGFTTNKIVNPSFESGINDWYAPSPHSFQWVQGDGAVGNNCMQITAGDTALLDSWENVSRPVGVGQEYQVGDYLTYSAYFKGGTSGRGCYILASCFNGGWPNYTGTFQSTPVYPSTSGWTRVSVTFQIPANTTVMGMNIQLLAGSTGTAFIDGVMLEKSSSLNPYEDGSTVLKYLNTGNIALGGGRSDWWDQNGVAGASGGGGSGSDTRTPTGGAGTAGQGFAGGNALMRNGSTYYSVAGGGGGAGGAGSNGAAYSYGAGGAGTYLYSEWATATSTGESGYYCSGGVGGIDSRTAAAPSYFAGPLGGGGGSTKVGNGDPGQVNTGGGGGGAGITFSPSLVLRDGGNGGSGLVIVRTKI